MMQKKAAMGRLVSAVLLVLGAIYLLLYTKQASGATVAGLRLCVYTVIPAVFPYLVLSSLFVKLGLADYLARPLTRVTRRFFALPGCCGGVILLGLLCGFPTGANMSVTLYKEGYITKEQAERLTAFCNFCGPSYIVSVLGMRVWHSTKKALSFFVLQSVLALLLGMLLGIGKKREREVRVVLSPASYSRAFTESITQACGATLSVCGYVTFFSVLLSAFSPILAGCSPTISALVCGVFEMSAGVSRLVGRTTGGSFAGVIVLWSGLSVWMQIQSLCQTQDGQRLSLALYLRLRLVLVVMGMIFAWIFDKI